MKTLVFDIGGTNTRSEFSKGKKLIESNKFKTPNNKRLLKELIKETERIKKKHKIWKLSGIAISAPGYLECDKLCLTAPINLKGIKNLKLYPLKKFTKKLVLENDANCASLGALSLEPKTTKNLACFTLGTGLGTGIIINRKIYKGKGNASEFGHTTIDLNGKKCTCGNIGCIENYISKKGLENLAKKRGLNKGCIELRQMAEKRNKKAISIFRDFGKLLTIPIVNIANTLDPDVIYLSGGLMNSERFFMQDVIKESRKRFFRGINPRVKVYKGSLGLIGGRELLR